MRIARTLLMALPLALLPAITHGEGLLYQLPEDGSGVQFEMKGTMTRNGMMRDYSGTLDMKSVGKSDENGAPCRWIEFKMVMKRDTQDRTIIGKVLIPENQLKAGQEPLDHLVRGWVKFGDSEPRELTDAKGSQGGPLPLFLSGPLSDVKKLESETRETPLGKLECAGEVGRKQFKQGSNEIDATLQTRRHEKAPFGVVASKMTLQMSRDGQPQQTVNMELTLSKIHKDATSELPDQN